MSGRQEGGRQLSLPWLPAGPSGEDGVSICSGAGFHLCCFSFLILWKSKLSPPSSKHQAGPTLPHSIPAWWLRAGDGAEAVKGVSGWDGSCDSSLKR